MKGEEDNQNQVRRILKKYEVGKRERLSMNYKKRKDVKSQGFEVISVINEYLLRGYDM